MSWADDIRCLHCEARLPLYRKITNGQFCSSAHRKAYWQEQERLAVERLQQTHDSLRAYSRAGAIEAVLGPQEPFRLPPGRMPLAPPASAVTEPDGIEPMAIPVAGPTFGMETERPWWMTLVNTDRIPAPGLMMFPSPLPSPHLAHDRAAAEEIEPFDWTDGPMSLCMEMLSWSQAAASAQAMAVAGPVEPLAGYVEGRIDPRIWNEALGVEAVPAAVTLVPLLPRPQDVPAQSDELKGIIETLEQEIAQQVPHSERLFALPRIAARDSAGAIVREISPATITLTPRLPVAMGTAAVSTGLRGSETLFALPRVAARDCAHAAVRSISQEPVSAANALDPQFPAGNRIVPVSAEPPIAGLRKLPVDRVPLVHGIWGDSLRAVDLRAESEAPELTLMTPVRRPRLKLAAGARYSIETRAAGTVGAKVEPAVFPRTTPRVALPEPPAAAHSSLPEFAVPAQTKLLALACAAQPSVPAMNAAPAVMIPQPPALEPIRPADSRLEPLDAKPASDFLEPLAGARRLPWMPELHVDGTNLAQVWTHSVGFWKHAPRDLKMLVFAIPLLLALALHPRLPKVGVKAPATAGGIQRNFERSLNEQWVNVKRSMLDRAAVALDEDFRSGLDDWATRGNLDASWSFDATGFVQPGPLALYRPSLGLTDYQVEFLGLIDKQAMSWVVRAADFDNYYVVKMLVLKPGPVPTIGITRYAVIDGKAQDRVDTLVPITARNDMLYRVVMDVHGEDFSLTVQGQMVDDWSEPRLKHGGIGFFSGRGEQSRIRWVQVTHQYDMLGRLCAYLAPYNIPTTNGSW